MMERVKCGEDHVIIDVIQAEDVSNARHLVITRIFVKDVREWANYNLMLPHWLAAMTATGSLTYYVTKSWLGGVAMAALVPVLYRLWCRYVKLHTHFEQYCPDLLSDEEFYEAWKGGKGKQFLVAKINGNVIGTASVDRLSASSAEIKRVALNPMYTGRGIAKEMIDQLVEFCRKENYTNIKIQVSLLNEHAAKLYRRYGFRDDEVVHYRGLFWWTALRLIYTL